MIRVIEIAKEVKKAGGRAFIVGGHVRDKFLGLESKDIDLEVFGIESEILKVIISKFGKAKECGKSFGVLKLDDLDISLPRRERKTGVGHKGFEAECDPYMSTEEACSRRDLTINAMLFDPLTNELIDPFNGLTDIKNKILRHVDDIRFAEDPLRVLRVAQFHARFGFSVHDDTNELCCVLIDELKHLSKERLFIEIEKILMRADKPSKGFIWMKEFGILNELFPELAVLETIEQGFKHHPEGSLLEKIEETMLEEFDPDNPDHKDRLKYKVVKNGNVFIHTMLALDSVPKKERDITLMFAILCHDMGKAIVGGVPKEDDPTHISFKGHEDEGIEVAETFLRRLTVNSDLIRDVCTLVGLHMRPLELKKNPKKRTIRRLALRVDIPLLMKVHVADKKGALSDSSFEDVDKILEIFEEIKGEIKPLIFGRHLISLGLTPSRKFGIILREVFESQLDGIFSTEEKGIEFTKKYIKLLEESEKYIKL